MADVRKRPSTPQRVRVVGVGLGTTAGGWKAFTQLLEHLPARTGLGFVVLLSSAAPPPGAVAKRLSRVTMMPVCAATDRRRVQANRVYVIPHDKCMVIAAGVLRVQPRAAGRVSPRPIDVLFESLAQDRQERAIGVLLSNAGLDGARGLVAIKAVGGVTLASVAFARHGEMPRVAVTAGGVDFGLPPDKLAFELMRLAQDSEPAGVRPERPERIAHENAELHATNVDVTTANEELRCLNEELETSTNELESANEALRATNEVVVARNAELKRLNADLHNLHANANTAIVVLSRDYEVRSFTPQAEQSFRLRRTDVGRPLSDIQHPLLVPEEKHGAGGEAAGRDATPLDLESLVREVIDRETPRVVEVQDGLGRWYSLRVRPYVTADRKVDGAVLVLVDIDALKRSERAAVNASRAKDEFLATLSHELRTPLSPVLLLASEGADDHSLPGHVRADFAAISTNIALEARLIDDLLDLTRVARGKMRLELQPCDAQAVLRDALAVVSPDIDAKHLHLVLTLAAERADVMGDPVRLQQVFWNVLRNAVHFTPLHGRITVETRTDPAGAELTVAITDTGIGIGMEDLSRIFDPFTQGDTVSAGSPRIGGLGLGLAISRTLVDLHAGSIHATSRGRGEGSTFDITLPLMVRDMATAPAVSLSPPDDGRARAAPVAEKLPVARRRVLIVDDHVPTRVALQHLLERRNYDVLTAGSVDEARAQAAQHTIDLLISDIGLPDGDGLALMQELRVRQPDLQGFALSGYGTEMDVARSQNAGFADHLIKPVTVAVVDRAIARVGSPRPAGNPSSGGTSSHA